MDIVSAFSFLTEFGCGYVLLRCISRLLNILGFLLIFGFCFKVLRFGWHTKNLIRFLCDSGGIPRIHLCLDKDQHHHPLPPQVPNPNNKKLDKAIKSPASQKSSLKGKANSEDGSEGGNDGNENEDEVFDVMTLRRLVKIERRKANVAWSDLEKERAAAASSAEEAMAMILRLQSEKSSTEIEANQFRRMTEERLEYDQEVIEELHWVITEHETQKSLLEDELGAYREKLKLYMKEEEIKELEIVDVDSGGGDDDGNGDGDGGGGGDEDDPTDDHHSVHRHSSSPTELQTLFMSTTMLLKDAYRLEKNVLAEGFRFNWVILLNALVALKHLALLGLFSLVILNWPRYCCNLVMNFVGAVKIASAACFIGL